MKDTYSTLVRQEITCPEMLHTYSGLYHPCCLGQRRSEPDARQETWRCYGYIRERHGGGNCEDIYRRYVAAKGGRSSVTKKDGGWAPSHEITCNCSRAVHPRHS